MDADDSTINIEAIEENVNKLSKKVQNTNPPILSFLNDPYCLPAFRDPPVGIKEYTKNHLIEILSISLSPDLDSKTIRAFYHFCFNNNPLSFKPILENGFFSNVSEVIIQNCLNCLKSHKIDSYISSQKYHLDDMSNAVLGRIATITFNSFYNCPKESMVAIMFLPDLLHFCYNASVCSLFEKLFTYNQRFNEIQNWLINTVQIHQKISEIIISYENDKKKVGNDFKINEIDDDYSFNIASMYKLLSYGLVSPNMCYYFRNELCTSTIIGMIKFSDIQKICDLRWYSAVCLCHPTTVDKLLPLVNIASSILISPTEILTGEIVNCISFISFMIKYSPIQTAKIINSLSLNFFSSIFRIITQFSSSTALHLAFRSFVINSIKNNLLMADIIKTYIPFFISEIHKRKNISNIDNNVEEDQLSTVNCINDQNSNSLPDNYSENFAKLKENSLSNLLYITCWDLIYKIDILSSFSDSSSKQSKKKRDISTNESSPIKSKSLFFSVLSSKFQKKQNQKECDNIGIVPNSNDNEIANSNNNNPSTNVKSSDIRNELFKIPNFDLFVTNEYHPYKKLLEESYGGPLPIIIADQQQMFVRY